MVKQFSRIIGLKGVNNFGVCIPDVVYRSAQPDNYSALHQMGIKSVLSLREDSKETAVLSANLKYFQLRLNVASEVTVEDFDMIIQTLTNPENQPILVHCYSGVDRTGVACAALRMAHDGWSLNEAAEEMAAYGPHVLVDAKLIYHLAKYAATKGFATV